MGGDGAPVFAFQGPRSLSNRVASGLQADYNPGPCAGEIYAVSMLVNEIFESIQGEGTHSGQLCTFVRFTACNLRCVYCDTAHAFHEGDSWERSTLVDNVASRNIPLVCVTGGEPLLQNEIVDFLQALLEAGHRVLLETSGSLSLSAIPKDVIKIVDVKTPGAFQPGWTADDGLSREAFNVTFHAENLATLTPNDEVKFVVTSRDDYLWARDFMREHLLSERVREVLFSPVHGEVDPQDLVAWMLQDRLDARLNLQLHKYVWSPETRGV